MQPLHSTDELIEALVNLQCGETGSLREKHLLRESLRNLVRLAKAEQAEALLQDWCRQWPTQGESVFH